MRETARLPSMEGWTSLMSERTKARQRGSSHSRSAAMRSTVSGLCKCAAKRFLCGTSISREKWYILDQTKH